MATITPCLTYDRQAEEAVRFYVSAVPGSEILNVTPLDECPCARRFGVPWQLAPEATT